MKFYNKESGQVSRLLVVLAVIVFVAIIITYLVMRAAEKPPKPVVNEPVVPMPTYEATLGDIKFIFEQARDMGNILKGSQSRNPSWQEDKITTERFIKVTIGAQNKGTANIKEGVWDLGDIVDSENRRFTALKFDVEAWLPEEDLCEALLKPEFEPTPCVKIYEVSKISTGLKIEAVANRKVGDEYPNDKKDTALIDLIVSK